MQIVFRGLVILMGLILFLIGLGFLFSPSSMIPRFSIYPASIAGFATMRGDLGGLFFGMAVFSFAGVLPSKSRWLIVPTVFLAAIILGRMVNLAVDGVSGPGVGPLLFEIVLVLVLIGAQKILPAADAAERDREA